MLKSTALRSFSPCTGGKSSVFRDEQLIDFMLQHPILINRPVVATPPGTRLCRPSEIVLDILPERQKDHLPKRMVRWSLTKQVK